MAQAGDRPEINAEGQHSYLHFQELLGARGSFCVRFGCLKDFIEAAILRDAERFYTIICLEE